MELSNLTKNEIVLPPKHGAPPLRVSLTKCRKATMACDTIRNSFEDNEKNEVEKVEADRVRVLI